MIEFNNNNGIYIADFGIEYNIVQFDKIIDFIKNTNEFTFIDLIDDIDNLYLVFKFDQNEFVLNYNNLLGMFLYYKKKTISTEEEKKLLNLLSYMIENIL